jgi:hypothetical protein
MLKRLHFFLYCAVITGFLVSNLDSNVYVAFSRYSFMLQFGGGVNHVILIDASENAY